MGYKKNVPHLHINKFPIIVHRMGLAVHCKPVEKAFHHVDSFSDNITMTTLGGSSVTL
jgi:hypothetical protein